MFDNISASAFNDKQMEARTLHFLYMVRPRDYSSHLFYPDAFSLRSPSPCMIWNVGYNICAAQVNIIDQHSVYVYIFDCNTAFPLYFQNLPPPGSESDGLSSNKIIIRSQNPVVVEFQFNFR